ncbi:MAG: hypothetical protein COV45_01140 [Deltaproteobacteria bacterium CG11_big_fil_rev_8_21_14_0_20_47_16]|nr:MAG: hypothetical protein COV45_01140 [Deltaproteobacteria bacterium CG11_big_fil_rev_8_21_14_0_20_47_16]
MHTILLTQDYFFWSKVDGTAKAVGLKASHAKTLHDIQTASNGGAIKQVLIDLRHPDFLETIHYCVNHKIPTIGFVSHMDSTTITAAKSAGCTTVMPKSQFSMNLAAILQK